MRQVRWLGTAWACSARSICTWAFILIYILAQGQEAAEGGPITMPWLDSATLLLLPGLCTRVRRGDFPLVRMRLAAVASSCGCARVALVVHDAFGMMLVVLDRYTARFGALFRMGPGGWGSGDKLFQFVGSSTMFCVAC